MVKIVSFSPIPEPLLRALIGSVYSGEVEIVVINDYDEQRILEAVRDADVVIGDYTFKIPITEKMMRAMERIKLIQQPSKATTTLTLKLQGRELTKRLQGWGVRIIYYDIKRTEDIEEKYGAEFRDFDSLLRESDILSIHIPLTNETRGMIGEKELRRMKSSAILINVARGEVVDEGALVKAIREKWIAGAALDVFAKEPPEGSELLELKGYNVLLAGL